jgi:hypothetical protein
MALARDTICLGARLEGGYSTCMMSKPTLRRLIDLPGVDDLELRALMKPAFAEPEARAAFPEIDACSRALFGLTADEAEDVPRPADWDHIERQPTPRQVFAFEDAGWDVTDNKRRPLRVFGHFNQQLWLAVRGVAGELPFQAEDAKPDTWASTLAAEAARFKRR